MTKYCALCGQPKQRAKRIRKVVGVNDEGFPIMEEVRPFPKEYVDEVRRLATQEYISLAELEELASEFDVDPKALNAAVEAGLVGVEYDRRFDEQLAKGML